MCVGTDPGILGSLGQTKHRAATESIRVPGYLPTVGAFDTLDTLDTRSCARATCS